MGHWQVWEDLQQRTHIELAWAYLVGHRGRIDELGNGRRLITLDARLRQVDRRAVLAHELVHDDRGILFTLSTPLALIHKEEAYVVAETARRLVPCAELGQLVRRAVDDGDPVGWREVAEWFDVPRAVAELALLQLTRSSVGPVRPRSPAAT